MLTVNELQNMTNEELVAIYQNRDDIYTPRESKEAVNVLIQKNQALAHSVIKRFSYSYRVDFSDAYMYALETLYLIASTYDVDQTEHRAMFSTYAVSQLYYKLTDLMNTKTYGDVSTHYASHHKPIRQAIQALKEERGTDIEPTPREICDWLKTFKQMVISQNTVKRCLEQMRFSNPLSIDDENNKHIPSTTDAETTDLNIYQAELQRDMLSALQNLPLEERFCFEKYYGYPDGKRYNADQIAKLMDKDPRFTARKKNTEKHISAFYVHKYLKNAALLLRKNALLRRYQHDGEAESVCSTDVLNNFSLAGSVDEGAISFMDEFAQAKIQYIAKGRKKHEDPENT